MTTSTNDTQTLGVCLPFRSTGTVRPAENQGHALKVAAEQRSPGPKGLGRRRSAARPSLPVDSTLPRFLTAKEVATMLRTSPSSLRDWRDKGYGPSWFKPGKNVLYRESVVLAWIDELERVDPAPAPRRRSA